MTAFPRFANYFENSVLFWIIFRPPDALDILQFCAIVIGGKCGLFRDLISKGGGKCGIFRDLFFLNFLTVGGHECYFSGFYALDILVFFRAKH